MVSSFEKRCPHIWRLPLWATTIFTRNEPRLGYSLRQLAALYSPITSHPQLASRNLPATIESLSQLPPFLPTGVRLPEVHKTGLGSSAALITSLVSSLLLHLGIIPANSFDTQGGLESASEGRKLAHNVAQYVHCLAQGKVGSGFDVSSAVFGSQIYTRFDPQVIQPLMEDGPVSHTAYPRVFFASDFRFIL